MGGRRWERNKRRRGILGEGAECRKEKITEKVTD